MLLSDQKIAGSSLAAQIAASKLRKTSGPNGGAADPPSQQARSNSIPGGKTGGEFIASEIFTFQLRYTHQTKTKHQLIPLPAQ